MHGQDAIDPALADDMTLDVPNVPEVHHDQGDVPPEGDEEVFRPSTEYRRYLPFHSGTFSTACAAHCEDRAAPPDWTIFS